MVLVVEALVTRVLVLCLALAVEKMDCAEALQRNVVLDARMASVTAAKPKARSLPMDDAVALEDIPARNLRLETAAASMASGKTALILL